MRRNSRYWLALVLVGMGFARPGLAQVQTVARDTLPVVRSVRVEGNAAFSDDRIKRAIATRASGCRSIFLSPFCWLGIGAFKRTERLDPRELRTDVARVRIYYFRRGYRQAQVDTTVERANGSVDVTFAIDEGQPIYVKSLNLEGFEAIEGGEALSREIDLEVGKPFSEVALNVSRERIERELRNRGYADAAILPSFEIPSQTPDSAVITLRAELGVRSRFGAIEVEGTVEVDPDDVRRMLSFQRGDIYSDEELARSQRTMYSMALFDYVSIEPELAESDSVIDVLIRVREAKARAVRFGLGVSTTECFQIEGGWAHRNFLGGTRNLEITGELSNIGASTFAERPPCSFAGVRTETGESKEAYNKVNWSLRANFRQPWFLGTENWLQLGVFSERQSLPRVYAQLSYGADIRLHRELGAGTAVIASYRPAQNQVESGSADVLWCSNFGICAPEDIGVLEEQQRLSWVALTLARSRTDRVLSPSRGYRWTAELETASRFTASDWAYYRAAGELSWFQHLGGGSILGLRVRGGLVRPLGSGLEETRSQGGDGITHPLKRHYAGGAFTVRGYGQNLLGPKVLAVEQSRIADTTSVVECNPDFADFATGTWFCDPVARGLLSSSEVIPRPVGGENSIVANAEVRVPLKSDRWTVVAFFDVGKVWTTDGSFRDAEAVRVSPGMGIRYRSPVGPLRLDVGYNTGGVERLPMVTALDDVTGNKAILQLVDGDGDLVAFPYDPYEGSGLEEFFNRLQLHFSIGHAF